MQICFNGEFMPAQEPVLTAQNRSFKWGDGVFETMKLRDGRLLLSNLHFERLFQSLRLLDMRTTFNEETILSLIINLCERNECAERARIRLAVFRNEKNEAEYLMEAVALAKEADRWREEGLSIDIYPYARKSQDSFATLKTANFLPYVLAAKFAEQHGLDDSLVLNSSNRICDSSRANIFLLRDGELFTPALSEGCVQGVMRRHLIDLVKQTGRTVRQQGISEDDLRSADEVFLTNAIFGIRWVKNFRDKQYSPDFSKTLYTAAFSSP